MVCVCVYIYKIYIRIVCFLSPSCDFAMRVCEVGADLTSLKQWCSSDSDTVLVFFSSMSTKALLFTEKEKNWSFNMNKASTSQLLHFYFLNFTFCHHNLLNYQSLNTSSTFVHLLHRGKIGKIKVFFLLRSLA